MTYIQGYFEEYLDSEKLDMMRISDGKVHNYITTAYNLQKAAGGEKDIYMSMNPLMRKNHCIRRDQEHVARLKWLYVDLDYYHSAYKDFSKTQIVGLLEMDYFQKSIPEPTYIIDSGRGLYLLWKIDENNKAYSRWVKMQKYLCDQLEEYGADNKVATDSARVLRCPGSINSKAGTEVSILSYSGRKYSLTSLMREYVVGDQPSAKMEKYARSISAALDIPLPDMHSRDAVKIYIQTYKDPANMFLKHQSGQKYIKARKSKVTYLKNTYTMLQARLQDLECLIRMRDQEHGHREHILFLYRYWQLCVTDDTAISLEKTLQLNQSLKNPLSEKEVTSATKSAEKYYFNEKSFRCSNTYVVEALNITADEMKYMTTLIGGTEKIRRKQVRNQRAYLASLKLAGKQTKSAQILKRRKQVESLLRKGLDCNEICNKLQISRATYYADKKAVEEQLHAKEQRKKALTAKFMELKKNSLKNLAFVLHMSFRTSTHCVPGVRGDYSYTVFYRFSRCLGYSILRSLSSWRCSLVSWQSACLKQC